MPTLVVSVRAEALNERQQMQTQMVRDPSPQTEFWTKINGGRGIVSAAHICLPLLNARLELQNLQSCPRLSEQTIVRGFDIISRQIVDFDISILLIRWAWETWNPEPREIAAILRKCRDGQF